MRNTPESRDQVIFLAAGASGINSRFLNGLLLVRYNAINDTLGVFTVMLFFFLSRSAIPETIELNPVEEFLLRIDCAEKNSVLSAILFSKKEGRVNRKIYVFPLLFPAVPRPTIHSSLTNSQVVVIFE